MIGKGLLTSVAALAAVGFVSCTGGGKEPKDFFSFQTYGYDRVSIVEDTVVRHPGDTIYWRSIGQGVLPVSMGTNDVTALRDTLTKLGFVDFAETGIATPRNYPGLKLTNRKPEGTDASNYSVNRVSIQLFSPRIAVWKCYLAYYIEGAAHSRYASRYVNYSIDDGKILSLTDIFRPGYEKPLTKILAERISELPDAYNDAEVYIPDNFYLTNDGITFVYGLYEIAPYSSGEIGISFNLLELSDYLRPEIHDMILGPIEN